MAGLASLGAGGALAAAGALSRPAEDYANDPQLETMWAMRAMDHAEMYFDLLCSVDVSLLNLTPFDDAILEEFRKCFPGLDVGKLVEEELKSPEAKEKWREFCEKFKKVPDYNFGTLLRLDAEGAYEPENSTIVPRVQFYAIELERNRTGLNDCHRRKTVDIGELRICDEDES